MLIPLGRIPEGDYWCMIYGYMYDSAMRYTTYFNEETYELEDRAISKQAPRAGGLQVCKK